MNDVSPQTSVKPLIPYGWLRAVLFLVAAIISSGIFSMLGLGLVALIYGLDFGTLITNSKDIIKDIGLPAMTIITFFGFVGMLIAAWIFRRFIDKKSFYSLGFSFSPYRKDFVVGLVLGAVLITLGFVIMAVLGMVSISETRFDFWQFSGYILFFLIGSLNEEIMIRGYFLNNFCESMNRYLALIISSLIFGLLHLGNANVTVLSVVNISLAGVLLGIYYIHTKNLWLPIGLHLSWNFFQGPVFGFEVSGYDVSGVIVQQVQGNEMFTGGPFGLEGSIIATVLMIAAIILLHYKYRTRI